jgi:hypothetical protein
MSPLRPIDGEERDELLIEAEIEHIETRFHRRQRIYLIVMAVLVITSVTLAVLNVRLTSRISALQSAAPAATVGAGVESKPIVPTAGAAAREPRAIEPASRLVPRDVESVPAPREARGREPGREPDRKPGREAGTAEPAAAERPAPREVAVAIPAAAPPEPRAPESDAPPPGGAPPSLPDTAKLLPGRRDPGSRALESLTDPRSTRFSASESTSGDPSERVAKWMIEAYGKRGAERQLQDALKFYQRDDERSRHWRRVLGHVRTAQDM